jgi:hypothetical protein
VLGLAVAGAVVAAPVRDDLVNDGMGVPAVGQHPRDGGHLHGVRAEQSLKFGFEGFKIIPVAGDPDFAVAVWGGIFGRRSAQRCART